MKSIELFTGAGGLAMGVTMAGFKHMAIVENNEYACRTIRENQERKHNLVRTWPVYNIDVRRFDFSSIKSEVDLVAGGPPCQPFSLGGRHQGNLDARDMFPIVIRVVRDLKPKAFIVENVKGLTRQTFLNYFNYICLQLRYPELVIKGKEGWIKHFSRLEKYHISGRRDGLHYRVISRVLNAADYGVPQRRERVFLVGFRSDMNKEWSFPEPTHCEDSLLFDQWISKEYWERHRIALKRRPIIAERMKKKIDSLRIDGKPNSDAYITVRDAISDLPPPTINGHAKTLNHFLVPGARSYKGHTGSPLDQTAKTLKAGVHGVPGGENMIAFGDGAVRYFTVRECARLQTFPDDYIFHGSWTETMRQLGNAVPVRLSSKIAKSVYDHLKTK